MEKNKILTYLVIFFAACCFILSTFSITFSFALQGTPLPGSAIKKWIDPLPTPYITGANSLELQMTEFQSRVMPTGFVPATGVYNGTWVWGYLLPEQVPGPTQTIPIPSYIGPVILAKRGAPTEVTYVNNLGDTTTSMVEAWKSSTDLTLHWADPLGQGSQMTNYVGPIPAVAHLHGGEVPPQLDGGPDSWFTSDGNYFGMAYYTGAGSLMQAASHPATGILGDRYFNTTDGKIYEYTAANIWAAFPGSIYRYPNTQEASNIWFHDHTMGVTRLNVYAGLAGGYLISDAFDTLSGKGYNLPAGLGWHDLGGETIIPLVLQDRMFDTNGQLYFPNTPINPDHPFWVPEFVGDTIVVNGKVWPTIGTKTAPIPSKRYRFLFLNGSNARTYDLFLVDMVTGKMGPPMWIIGTDGGYLDAPVKIDPNGLGMKKLLMMPGERYDVIIDFNDPAWRAANPAFSGQLVLRNTAKTPFPNGAYPTTTTIGQIVKLFIGAPVADTSYDPASGVTLRGDPSVTNPIPPIVRLPGTPKGPAIVETGIGQNVHKVRQLTLNEVMGPGGPLDILVNNTELSGFSRAIDRFTNGVRPDFTPNMSGTSYLSEMPQEGETEVWDIINLTADAHPVHLHLVQFQLVSRQKFNVTTYNKLYNSLFPGSSKIDPMTGLPFPPGTFIGGFGPPADYNTGKPWSALDTFGKPSVTKYLGGNPDVRAVMKSNARPVYMKGTPTPPQAHEEGWKDTVIMYPGEVTRIVVRWSPTDMPIPAAPADITSLYYPFDPNDGYGYVWHCHIIDHEDDEMMRPDSVVVNPAAVGNRSYIGLLDGGFDF